MPLITKIRPVLPVVEPIGQSERIPILDSLRGIAILGILLMNIQGFGLPHLLVFDVSILNETGLNYYAWYIFGPGVFEGSMRAIFSMLFGAGTIIFISRLEIRMKHLKPIGIFFRRQVWLAFFGLLNTYVLLWSWDILLPYAICGLLVLPFRRLKPRYLLLAASIGLVLITINENLQLYTQKATISKGEKLTAIDTSIRKLTATDRDDLAALNKIKQQSNPEQKKKKVEEQIAEVRRSYVGLFRYRREVRTDEEAKSMYSFLTWDILLFIFLGMVFFKTGIFHGEVKTRFYLWLAVLGLGIGIPLSYLYLKPDLQYHYNHFEIIKNRQFAFYELQRLVHSLGIFGLIMVIYKSGRFKWLFTIMRPVGQMAFTNYLMQSLLCGLFFYGVGFGMFGELHRFELYYVVVVVWLIEIVWSNLWLKYFRFGPFEWTWRSLTYWKLQPMKKSSAHSA